MVYISDFGKSKKYTIDNGILKAVLLDYGARLIELHYEGKNVCLSYDRFEDFEKSEVYVGSTVGRYANRIANAKFTLDGTEYKLDMNEGNTACLHGGSVGLDKKFWNGEILSENSVRFTLFTPDGDMGFPGNMNVAVIFALEKNTISIQYETTSDKDTIANITCHTYFNLDGFDGEDCRNMLLQLNADHYLPTAASLLPTGEILSVDKTEFDFRNARAIGGEYDHCFVLGLDRKYRKAGTLYSPKSGIQMEIETDLPALQIYSCYRLEDSAGKDNIPLHYYQALAIEPEMFPDSPHHKNFPSVVLRKGNILKSCAKFIFTKR